MKNKLLLNLIVLLSILSISSNAYAVINYTGDKYVYAFTNQIETVFSQTVNSTLPIKRIDFGVETNLNFPVDDYDVFVGTKYNGVWQYKNVNIINDEISYMVEGTDYPVGSTSIRLKLVHKITSLNPVKIYLISFKNNNDVNTFFTVYPVGDSNPPVKFPYDMNYNDLGQLTLTESTNPNDNTTTTPIHIDPTQSDTNIFIQTPTNTLPDWIQTDPFEKWLNKEPVNPLPDNNYNYVPPVPQTVPDQPVIGNVTDSVIVEEPQNFDDSTKPVDNSDSFIIDEDGNPVIPTPPKIKDLPPIADNPLDSDNPLTGDNGLIPETPKNGETGLTPDTPKDGETGLTPEAPKDGETGLTPEAPKDGETGLTPDTPKDGEAGLSPDTPKDGEAGLSPDTPKDGETGLSPESPLLPDEVLPSNGLTPDTPLTPDAPLESGVYPTY